MSATRALGYCLIASLAVAISGNAGAQASARLSGDGPYPQAIPDGYAKAPPPWRDFLTKASQADAIADPLKRCLAFPDFPGTHWQPGLMKVHCEYSLGLGFGQREIGAHVDAGDVAWLDRTFGGLQARHSSQKDFSEHIHNAFEQFGGDYESGRISKRWLELQPNSPYAMVARANFYLNLGWAARGNAWISETPPEQRQLMAQHHDKALALFRKALAKEPKLMPAYVGLVDLSRNGLVDGDEIFAEASKVDPACKVLLSERMDALKPRWGGSYREMLALEKQMLPHLKERPLLALSRIWPYLDLGDTLARDKRYDEAVKAVEPMLDVSSSPQVQEDLATYLNQSSKKDPWRELALLVSATRFRPGGARIGRLRGYLQMYTLGDTQKAMLSLAGAAAQEPESAYGHSLYAQSLSSLGRNEEAEKEYLRAMQADPSADNRRDLLPRIALTLGSGMHPEKGLPYARKATTEFPKDPMGWYAQGVVLFNTRPRSESPRPSFERFLALANPTIPLHASRISSARSILGALDREKGGSR